MGMNNRKEGSSISLALHVEMALTRFAVLPYVVADSVVLTHGAGGLYWLVPAIVISFIKALLDAWVMLVEINR